MVQGNDILMGIRRSTSGSGEYQWNNKLVLFQRLTSNSSKFCSVYSSGKRRMSLRKRILSIFFTVGLMALLFLLDSLLGSLFDPKILHNSSAVPPYPTSTKENRVVRDDNQEPAVEMYGRLLNLASAALSEAEFRQDGSKFWKEPYHQASVWKPCADRKGPQSAGKLRRNNGFILVSANGGLNQQRVAVCNAVAVASLLNATLVIPRFLYSNVWKDPSQFGDIYQLEHFMNTLNDDVNIVTELPPHLNSLHFESMGSLITDADISKEATPSDYITKILPLLLRNRVVHFFGFGNRLGFDPLPPELQSLRCKCNFHALKFVPKIQEIGSLLIRRIRKHDAAKNTLDKQLLGNFFANAPLNKQDAEGGQLKYIALHLRFEVDMVAYSLCEFGGGENERAELQAYRENHFPLLMKRLESSKAISAAGLRRSGKCPLTPEEAGLVLAALGFTRETYIYLAGSQIYGGHSRMDPLTRLFPNLITKEDLLTPSEIAPFRNFSSQMAALDFIACATADVFAITDSGSQLSSLVSGFRTYYGGGRAPTLRPNKKWLAMILSKNNTIRWNDFRKRVQNMIEDGQRVRLRATGRSIYRQPRCPECMCN